VNVIIGLRLLVTWSAGKIPLWAALIFLAIITTLVSVFGYFIVHRYERYAWILMILSLWLRLRRGRSPRVSEEPLR
jgi:purine-cytosine permease-like protein